MSEEKTEKPSEFKLKQGRNKGQVAKTADISAWCSLSLAALALWLTTSIYLKEISSLLSASIHNPKNFTILLKESYDLWLLLSLPILLSGCLGSIIGNIIQIGWLFTTHPLKPDSKRINPFTGIKKLFSIDRIIDIIKQLSKLAIIFLVSYREIRSSLPHIRGLYEISLWHGYVFISHLIVNIFIKVLLCFLVIAAIDWLWSRYSFYKSMRMSKYEVKKEYHQQEGDPHLKHEQKKRHQEMLEAGSANIQQAKVLITNPSHLAIAIKFDENIDDTPKVCARGINLMAKALIEEAKLYEIPILRNVPLARDLSWLKINEEIPVNLYHVIAEILIFINELEKKSTHI